MKYLKLVDPGTIEEYLVPLDNVAITQPMGGGGAGTTKLWSSNLERHVLVNHPGYGTTATERALIQEGFSKAMNALAAMQWQNAVMDITPYMPDGFNVVLSSAEWA